jgi:hypothetical protein
MTETQGFGWHALGIRMFQDMDIPSGLRKQAEAVVALHADGVAVYTAVVDDLIAGNSRDSAELERTLDGLLGFACTDDGVQLYRRLCRYIWDVDSELAARAANAYREMWDPDEDRPWQRGDRMDARTPAGAAHDPVAPAAAGRPSDGERCR